MANRYEVQFRGEILPAAEIRATNERALQRSALTILRRVRENLTGRFLKVQTGRSRSSVAWSVDAAAGTARVGSSAIPLAIHEGGVSHPWVIVPRGASALRFKGRQSISGSGWVYSRRVTHPAMPARPSFGTALTESRLDVETAFRSEWDATIQRLRGGAA